MWNTMGVMGNARIGTEGAARQHWGSCRESRGRGTGLLSLGVQDGLSPPKQHCLCSTCIIYHDQHLLT